VDSSETFHDHVTELRNRIIVVAFSVGLFSLIGYVGRNKIIYFIHKPFNSPLYYNTPAGAFNLTMKIALVIGIFFSLPILIYNIIKFLEPTFSQRLKKGHVNATLLFSCVLAISGAAFGYYILLPMSLHFFGGYSSQTISPLISANEYFNYVINLVITFAILFQIPLIIDFINRIKPFKPRQLLKYQKYIIVGAIVIALVLPFTYDPVTQFVVAIPIVLLYYLSIIMVMVSNRKKKEKVSIAIGTTDGQYTPTPEIVSALATNVNVTDQKQEPVPEPVTASLVSASSSNNNVSQTTTKSPKILAAKYFDVVPANTIDQDKENSKLSRSQPTIKQIKKTRFVDGFRPTTNVAGSFS
jgi:sec-independent protein translocase protein TatC